MNDEQSASMKKLVEQQQISKNSFTDYTLKITGIFYTNDENWTIWINGTRYSSVGQYDNFSIDKVEEDAVTITFLDGVTKIFNVFTDDETDSNVAQEQEDGT
jgi:hypothetical protein